MRAVTSLLWTDWNKIRVSGSGGGASFSLVSFLLVLEKASFCSFNPGYHLCMGEI